MRIKRMVFQFFVLLLVSASFLSAVSLHPDFTEKLRREGRLDEVLRAWQEAHEKLGIDRVTPPQPGTVLTNEGLIFILVDFIDKEATHNPAEFDTIFALTNTYPSGSMMDFYNENSFNQFNLNLGVTDKWYRMPNTYAFYGTNYGFTYSGLLAQHAVAAADPDIDFGQYDNDGPDGIPNSGDDDGRIDGVIVVHAGPGYEEGGCGLIWSHMSSTSYQTNDPRPGGGYIYLREYAHTPETHCDQNFIIDIGVNAHEYGHIIGLPDLYDGDGSSAGLGAWSLMASGSWNGWLGASPAHMDAYCKTQLGWVIPTELSPAGPIEYLANAQIPQVETSPVIYKLIYDTTYRKEYFLVENRQQVGLFDSHIPGHGLLIYHVHEDRPTGNTREFIPCVSPPNALHYEVALEQADGHFQLEKNLNSGEQGDPFPGNFNRRYFLGFSFIDCLNSDDYRYQNTGVGVFNVSDSDSLMTANLDANYRIPLLHYEGNRIDDSVSGDGDSLAEPGETVNLILTLKNAWNDSSWGDAETISVTIETDDPAINFIKSTATFPPIPAGATGDNSTDPFIFSVDHLEPRWITFILHFDCIPPNYPLADTFSMIIGQKGYILVDDDQGKDYEDWYEQSLNNLGHLYDRWDVSLQGSPALSALSQYKTAIWFTGQSDTGLLTPQDTTILAEFLKSGHSLFFSSENLGEAFGTDPFYSQYFHSTFINGWANDQSLLGISGDEIGDGLAVKIDGGMYPQGSDSEDEIAPLADADTVLVYSPGKVGAIKYAGKYKLVYFAFPFEAIPEVSGGGYTGRDGVMDRVLTWLTSLAPPESLTATSGAGYVDLNWRPPQGWGWTLYTLYRCTLGCQYSLLTTVPRDTLHYRDVDVLPDTIYYYVVKAYYDVAESDPSNVAIGIPTGVAGREPLAKAPQTFALFQNLPNPFRELSAISYQLPTKNRVTLKIYNISGQLVKTLVDESKDAGQYKAFWNGRNNAGEIVGAGVYFYRLTAGNFQATKRLLFLQ